MIIVLRILRGIIGFVGASQAVSVVFPFLPSPKDAIVFVNLDEIVIRLLISVMCLSLFLYSRRMINYWYHLKDNRDKLCIASPWSL